MRRSPEDEEQSTVGQRFKTWLKRLWHQFRQSFKAFWHRYQLTRWIIVIILGFFLIASTSSRGAFGGPRSAGGGGFGGSEADANRRERTERALGSLVVALRAGEVTLR